MSWYNADKINKNTKIYPNTAEQVKFLLGGIGTGNISLGSRAQLCDFEIFNAPNKDCKIPYTFFALRTQLEGEQYDCRILEAVSSGPFNTSNGTCSGDLAGLPRFQRSTFKSRYPFAWIDLMQDNLPFDVSVEAFTPFVPLHANDSSIPGFVLRYRVKNRSSKRAQVSVAGSLCNVCGFVSYNNIDALQLNGAVANEYLDETPLKGVYCTSHNIPQSDITFGTLALTTADPAITVKPNWLESGWWDGPEDLWRDFCEDGRLEFESKSDAKASVVCASNNRIVGSVAISHTLEPNEEQVFEYYLTWCFPNRYKGWDIPGRLVQEPPLPTIKNHYSALYPDAKAAALFLHSNLSRLEPISRDFANAMFSSDLDIDVIDAMASTITVLRSPTCFRIEDGTFFAWEGCETKIGCCRGSCTHVWNYEQSLAFLFPELERSMRENEFLREVDKDGAMAFRSLQLLENERCDLPPATDGQMGCIVSLYRDWKLSGDDEFLCRLWPQASKALNFAFDYWDSDEDCVLDSQQHNTYDIEFYGVVSATNAIFFAALQAGVQMAEYMGDDTNAQRWKSALSKGPDIMDRLTWNGKYYQQFFENTENYRYQIGTGCLSDQLLGQQLAHVAGLGYILPPEHVKSAVQSIFQYNYRTSFYEHQSVQRGYAFNDEKGLVLCSWPKSGRPSMPFVYCDEVWTGTEYQVASHLIFEGFVEEGLTLVRAVRSRHDGYRRNPFNEVECGNHYARSLSCWSLLIALSGYRYDMGKKTVSFAPTVGANSFSCFFSNGKCWGVYSQTPSEDGSLDKCIEVLYGDRESTKLV